MGNVSFLQAFWLICQKCRTYWRVCRDGIRPPSPSAKLKWFRLLQSNHSVFQSLSNDLCLHVADRWPFRKDLFPLVAVRGSLSQNDQSNTTGLRSVLNNTTIGLFSLIWSDLIMTQHSEMTFPLSLALPHVMIGPDYLKRPKSLRCCCCVKLTAMLWHQGQSTANH